MSNIVVSNLDFYVSCGIRLASSYPVRVESLNLLYLFTFIVVDGALSVCSLWRVLSK